MIVLDTHIWIWWVQRDERLTEQHQRWLQGYCQDGIGVSIISCWEVAKLVEKKRLTLPLSVERWLGTALAYPGIRLLELTVPIVVRSTQLENFHKDPADQIIVATALTYDCPLMSVDAKIVKYPTVRLLK